MTEAELRAKIGMVILNAEGVDAVTVSRALAEVVAIFILSLDEAEDDERLRDQMIVRHAIDVRFAVNELLKRKPKRTVQ